MDFEQTPELNENVAGENEDKASGESVGLEELEDGEVEAETEGDGPGDASSTDVSDGDIPQKYVGWVEVGTKLVFRDEDGDWEVKFKMVNGVCCPVGGRLMR